MNLTTKQSYKIKRAVSDELRKRHPACPVYQLTITDCYVMPQVLLHGLLVTPCDVRVSWRDEKNFLNKDCISVLGTFMGDDVSDIEILENVAEHVTQAPKKITVTLDDVIEYAAPIKSVPQPKEQPKEQSPHHLEPDAERAYLTSLQVGERVIETASSCMCGVMGTVVNNGNSVKWDSQPGDTGHMTTSITHGTRRVVDYLVNMLREVERTMITCGDSAHPWIPGARARPLLRDIQHAINSVTRASQTE